MNIFVLVIVFFIGFMLGGLVISLLSVAKDENPMPEKGISMRYKKVIKPMFYDPMWDLYGCTPESVPEYPEWYDESMREEIFLDLQEIYLSKEICFYEKYVKC